MSYNVMTTGGSGLSLAVVTLLMVRATLALGREARRDRELTWAPSLTWTHEITSELVWQGRVGNVGNGPGLGCIRFGRSGDSWHTTSFRDVTPGDSADMDLSKHVGPVDEALFVPPEGAQDQNERCDSVLF
ncbi:MAG TPA: hypothetical protein VMU64_01020, partial [Acidimicrobiales bacterium]|nr:hypothetical protein [Acidimicrobiales bacterium]